MPSVPSGPSLVQVRDIGRAGFPHRVAEPVCQSGMRYVAVAQESSWP